MAFERDNLRPVGRNSVSGNVLWLYVSNVDPIADITAPGYVTGTTGVAVLDMILAIGVDGTAEIGVESIGGAGEVTPFVNLGGVSAENVTVDQTNLADIGGGTLDPNVQANLERIHNRLNLKFQRLENLGTGSGLFVGSQTDVESEKVGLLRSIAAGDGIAVDVINDAVVISLSDTGGGTGGGGSGGTNGSLIPPAPADLSFDTGNALRYVTKNTGLDPIGGEVASTKHATIQAGVNAANPGDIVLVRSDVYAETVSLTNKAGSVANPIWIVAEERGQAFISGYNQSARNGQSGFWTADGGGGGVFFRTNVRRPFFATHNGDFLMYYKTEADLRASSVSGVTKPSYGIAFVPNGGSTASNATGTLFIRLRGNVNPNGQRINLPSNYAQVLFDLNNCDNIIVDGFTFEGSGNTEAINFDTSCANGHVRNCVFEICGFGVRPNTGCLISTCEYVYTGFGKWAREIGQLDGVNANGVFTLLKDYYVGTVIGSNAGNALLERGFVAGRDPTLTGIVIDRCLIGPTFDGNRIGEFDSSEVKFCVYLECRDDGDQNESFRANNRSQNNQIHDSRFIDCFVAYSRQEASNLGDSFFYRNVVENREPLLRHNTLFILKTIKSTTASIDQVYHNTFINKANPGATSQFLWYDFSNGSGNTIRNLKNNIVIFENGFTNGGGPNPQSIGGNAFVGPVANGIVQGSGGVFAGTNESAMGLNADLSLPAGSPAAGIGIAINSGFPDTGLNQDDAGAFPVGVAVGENWPRERTRTFDLTKPVNWPK